MSSVLIAATTCLMAADETPAAKAAPAAASASAAAAPAESSSPPLVNVEEDDSSIAKIDRANFTLSYPSSWKEDVTAKDHDANLNFTLVSPKNSYIQFTLLPKAEEPAKIVGDTIKKLDGPAITTLSKTKLEEWGNHKGQGYHLKGKIVGSFPGGVKIFVFSSQGYQVLIIEEYFSDELRDIQHDLNYIRENFVMKN